MANNTHQIFQYQIHTEPVLATAERASEDKFHQPWSEPVRQKINPVLAVALLASGLFFTPQQAQETTFVSKWYEALSEPVRQKPPLLADRQTSLIDTLTPEFTFESKWHFPWSEPVRIKQAVPVGEQTFLITTLREPLVSFSYYNWLTEPVRFRPILIPADNPYLFEDTNFIPFPSNFIEGWYNWYSEPVRFKQGLSVTLQQTLAYHPRLLPKPNITATLSAFEVNSDAAIIAVSVVNFILNVTVSASVSVAEIPNSSATSIVEQT